MKYLLVLIGFVGILSASAIPPMVPVTAGDVVNMETWARYNVTTGGVNSLVSNLASLVSSAFTGVSGVSEANRTTLSNAVPGVSGNIPNGGGNNEPKAYLNYILFNSSYVQSQYGFVPVSDDGYQTYERLTTGDLTMPVSGYLYIYVANESTANVDVWFDDLKIIHQKANNQLQVVGAKDYYPFGLPIAGTEYWNEARKSYKYGYQGIYSEQDSLTKWNTFALRSYDPALGRFISSDPFQQFANPYNGMGNNPVNFNDPSGGYVLPEIVVTASRILPYVETAGRVAATAGALYGYGSLGGGLAGRSVAPSGGYAIEFPNGAFNGEIPITGTGTPSPEMPGQLSSVTPKETDPLGGISSPDAPATLDKVSPTVRTSGAVAAAKGSVGQPGFWESAIPVWGSGRAAYDDFQNGNYLSGAFNTAMAISDVFLVKALYTGAAKLITKASVGVLAKQATKKPVIIGENMKRVRQYAKTVNGQAYKPWKNSPFNYDLGMRRNKEWIKRMKAQGREIIDIGPDFSRRLNGKPPSDFYNMERSVLRGYNKYSKVFVRKGRGGGVRGFDF